MTADGIPDESGLQHLSTYSCVLGKAFQLRRDSLWWTNLVTLVLPAILTTLVAILSAIPNADLTPVFGVPITSVMAGAAAILIAVHKAMKCEEYQAECLRLSRVFSSIALEAELALRSSRALPGELNRLSDKLTSTLESMTATVPDRLVRKAEIMCAKTGNA